MFLSVEQVRSVVRVSVTDVPEIRTYRPGVGFSLLRHVVAVRSGTRAAGQAVAHNQ